MSIHLSLLDHKAEVLYHLLLRSRSILTVEDILALPEIVSRWAPDEAGKALAILIADGRVTDDAYGRVHVEGWGE